MYLHKTQTKKAKLLPVMVERRRTFFSSSSELLKIQFDRRRLLLTNDCSHGRCDRKGRNQQRGRTYDSDSKGRQSQRIRSSCSSSSCLGGIISRRRLFQRHQESRLTREELTPSGVPTKVAKRSGMWRRLPIEGRL